MNTPPQQPNGRPPRKRVSAHTPPPSASRQPPGRRPAAAPSPTSSAPGRKAPKKPEGVVKRGANEAARKGVATTVSGLSGGTLAPVAGFIAGVFGNDEKAKRNRKRLYIAVSVGVLLQVFVVVGLVISMVMGIALIAGGVGAAGTAKRDNGQCLDINAPRVTVPGAPGAGGRSDAPAGTLGAPLDPKYMVTASGFGNRVAPTAGATSWHDGVDFSGADIHGKPIYAPADGVVDQAGPSSGYGNWVILNHNINGQKVSTLYGHIDNGHVRVKPGQRVTAGQHIADVGNSGFSTGPHLHFGVYPGGWKPQAGVDPMPWLSKFKAAAANRAPDSARAPPPANAVADNRGASGPATPGVVSKADWQKLAQCESGGNWKINTGNGFSGGIQFTASSWSAAGGTSFAPSPHQATPEQQMEAANKLLIMQGWGAWPSCSSKQSLTGLKPAPEGTFARKDGRPAGGSTNPPPAAANPPGNLPPTSKGSERNLQAAAQRGMRLVAQQFPTVTDIGGYRDSNNPLDHGTGSAIDAMVPNYASPQGIALGDQISKLFIDHAGELKTKYVIWRNRIWQNGSWTDYGSTGDDNLKHNNHVHISFNQSGPPKAIVPGLPGVTTGATTTAPAAAGGPEGVQPYTPGGSQKAQILNPEQQANIKALISSARRAGIKPEGRAAVLAVAYAGAQTNFVSRTPTAEDPRIGIFGEVPLEGTADTSNLINVPYAANAFFDRLKQFAAQDKQWATRPLDKTLVGLYPEQATRGPEFGSWEQLAIGAVRQLWGDQYAKAGAPMQSVTNIDCAQGSVLGRSLKPGTVPPRFVKWITLAGQICEGITAPLLAAQIRAESGFNEQATSEVGALGSSQFMPGTWQTWGKKVDGSGKPTGPGGSGDPRNAADATMAQGNMMCADYQNMRKLIASGRVKGDPVALTIASYNAGLGAVLDAGGMPSGGDYTTQTQPYVEKIMRWAREYDGGAGQLAATGGRSNDSSSATGGYRTVVEAARQQVGKPYVWGTKGPDSFDCSGLMAFAYKKVGVDLSGATYSQIKQGTEVSRGEARPGDLVFSRFSAPDTPEHVSMYIGNGRVVQAHSTEVGVVETPLPTGKLIFRHVQVQSSQAAQ